MIRSTVVAASLTLASASHAQVFLRIVESEIATSSRAEVHVLVDEQTDRDTSRPFPRAETEAAVGMGTPIQPRVTSRAEARGTLLTATTMSMEANIHFDVGDSFLPTPARRAAAGSWRHYVRFEIVRAARVDLYINPRLFDEVSYSEYTPGTLTGPSGVVVSGPPSPGASSWIWQLTLPPGEYTFEANATFVVSVDTVSRLSDSASHNVRFSTRSLACLADFDGDGELTVFDFLVFQNVFDARRSEADLNGDGELTLTDFLVFQRLFDAGCP